MTVNMITIEEIKAAGKIPESFYNIAPGCAVFYASEDGVSASTKRLVVELYEKCAKEREDFVLKIEVETTSNQFLADTIVARRLNVGSLCRYNLLMAPVNSGETVDGFVKEFFNLTSRNDEALKWINKKPRSGQPTRPRYDGFDESSFAPTSMTMGMIVMRPPVQEKEEDEDVMAETSELTEDLNEILQKVLAFADKYKQDVPKDILFPLAMNKYILTDDTNVCKLVFTHDDEFWLKAGTMVNLKLSKLQKALYLLLLAHPKGIETKRLSEHRAELMRYYELVFKVGKDREKMNEAIDKLIDIDDPDMPALRSLRSKMNRELARCILNRTSQLPFKVQNTNGVLHVDLPRKFFVCEDEMMRFEVKK